MKIFRIPEHCTAILFDMDCTLYTHDAYAHTQIDLPIQRLAEECGMSFYEMSCEINRYREQWAAEHDGRQISLANAFTAYGVPIEESIKWREEMYQPERYLEKDERLIEALRSLCIPYILAVVTNNPVSIAKRTLSALGIYELFDVIVGLDTCGISKPHEIVFRTAAERCAESAEYCISVGDRYDIDIALPLEMGMGGILVDGVTEVYRLPEIL